MAAIINIDIDQETRLFREREAYQKSSELQSEHKTLELQVEAS